MFDSTQDSLIHIGRVQHRMSEVIADLSNRALDHDQSKFSEPEKAAIDRVRPLLKTLAFGSPEYYELKKQFSQFHYAVNDHHAEFWPNGINNMSLVHLTEMMCDWQAATETNGPNDNILASIEILRGPLGIGPQLEQIMLNTVFHMRWA